MLMIFWWSCFAFFSRVVSSQSVEDLVSNKELKYVFVGGKGGVGKTTSSSAIATQLARDRQVLLVGVDAARSLSDTFRMGFSHVPKHIKDQPNLTVMEVDSDAIMQRELALWAQYAAEVSASSKDLGSHMRMFQEWLAVAHGADEALAVNSALQHIESGKYDQIVFDTAPTGHTLNMLELPEILKATLDKVEASHSTFEAFTSFIGGGSKENAKEKIAQKLKKYTEDTQKVAGMLTDPTRTRFVLVCIPEAISECKHVISDLQTQKVQMSHVIMNQLVPERLEEHEVEQLETTLGNSSGLSSKALAAVRAANAKHAIQRKYMDQLKDFEATSSLNIVETPLMNGEVTGFAAIQEFADILVGKSKSPIVKKKKSSIFGGGLSEMFQKLLQDPSSGADRTDRRRVVADNELNQKPDRADRRRATEGGPRRLLQENLGKEEEVQESEHRRRATFASKMADEMHGTLSTDPEFAPLVKAHPELIDKFKECREHPESCVKHAEDPQMSKFFKKAMEKLGHSDMNELFKSGPTPKKKKKQENKGLGDLEDLWKNLLGGKGHEDLMKGMGEHGDYLKDLLGGKNHEEALKDLMGGKSHEEYMKDLLGGKSHDEYMKDLLGGKSMEEHLKGLGGDGKGGDIFKDLLGGKNYEEALKDILGGKGHEDLLKNLGDHKGLKDLFGGLDLGNLEDMAKRMDL